MGTLNRYLHTTGNSGNDSVVKTTVSCSSYKFHIDHAKRAIWNSDSLPFGIDASKVVCTLSTKNSASAGWKSWTSDSLTTYSSSDSIDFTKPREFYVYNTNGNAYRVYTISVNVHQEKGDSCIWTMVANGNQEVASLTAMKALSLEDNVYLFGVAGTTPKVYTSTITDGQNWTELATTPALSAEAYKNIVLKEDAFFCLSDGKLLTSTDAQNWTEVSEPSLKSLVAATTAHLYGISEEGKMMASADNGLTWVEEELDSDASLLPSEDMSYACHTLKTNTGAEKVVLIGNRSLEQYPDDTTAVVWTKIDEYKMGSRNHAWNYVTQNDDNSHKAPRAKNWQVVSYDNPNFKAVCGEGIGNNKAALNQIYQSGDEGITWIKDSVMVMPNGIAATNNSFAMTTDKNNSVWIVCGGTGQVWKVRFNRLVWKKEQEVFE